MATKQSEDDDSYFGRQADKSMDAEMPHMPPAKRTRTAPVEDVPRLQGLSRRSTLLEGIRGRATGGARPIYDSRSSYSYAFDPQPSDTDSSSDEEGADHKEENKTALGHDAQPPKRATTEDSTMKAKSGKRHAYSRFLVGNEHFRSKGRISKRDGRLNISVNETSSSGYIAKALGQSLKQHLDVPKRNKRNEHRNRERRDVRVDVEAQSVAESLRTTPDRPKLNIVIMVIGSRGDIQPFLRLGKILKEQYGHRVRVASHPTFRDFVQKENGLDFFSVGGDPAELMAFMVKNPGLVPNLQTIRENEIQRRRKSMAVMFDGFWRACINTTDDEQAQENLKMMGDKPPFVADAIIANPPSMAHVHIAEKLGIPLHMMFTFPYTPTQQFPHPLASIRPQKSNVDASYVNFMSFGLVEMMTWQGLGDIVNRFRERTLGLEPVSSLWAPGALYRMKVPYTYLWSPSLIPKPKDWGPEIDIAGFVFLDLASNFKPPKDLHDFLNAGEPPIYVGFGSIVVDDPNALTEMIFKATKQAGIRALVNKGWGGFGTSNEDTPDHIFMLENTPHDWLFPKVKAVVHHGGAGTTAIGLKCAKPTMIVPFFGDQQFWGAMVSSAKAGAHECTPYKNLTVEKFTEGIKHIAAEGDGAENAVKSFHRSLRLAGRQNMRCSLLEDRVAVWQLRKSALRLSPLAAELLHETGKIKWSDLKLLRHYEWNDFDGPGEPITGSVAAVKDSLYDMGAGVGMVPVRIAKHIQKHEQAVRKRKMREERKRQKALERAERADEQATDGSDRPQLGRNETQDTQGSLAATPSAVEPLAHEIAADFGSGLKRAGGALLTMPNDLHIAIAQGFHNAPRLWGDATVRKPVRITGFRSGCVAARREFTYGVYDGWSGLVTQPMGEWRDGATMPGKCMGLGLGFAKGIGGFVLKNLNAVVAPPAYVGKGVIKYVEKKAEGPGSKVFIRRAQILRGQLDLNELQAEESKTDESEKSPLYVVRDQVSEGYNVYEEIWNEANSLSRYEFRKEYKDWDVNGALENANTASRALKARRKGQDLNQLWAKRRQEMQEAEQPRASAMHQPQRPDEDHGVLANGRKTDGDDTRQPSLGATMSTGQPEHYLASTQQAGTGHTNADMDEHDSECTMIGEEEESKTHVDSSRDQVLGGKIEATDMALPIESNRREC
ncbi:hypothetical protein LTR78_001331 [Recurvomyces mirabilis]|uniref:Glycosyltransferase family 28 N-terminal domain-containing protein n=1 Tax=Recurvomyces mirabilis TaxID=574656 RepID=A0AAE0WVF3_9PEZI|nr:hypothetical protein LTR78_001331 [Recurvomyces mirabilis]KAK5161308.1 hypothetical protein LTS14_001104 [Recurvomyces mirabilis]